MKVFILQFLNEEIDNQNGLFLNKFIPKFIKNIQLNGKKATQLVAYTLLYYVLKTEYNLECIELYHNSYGKPYLVQPNFLQFNMSYSNGIIVLAINSLKEPIGIDVEKVRDYKERIAMRFYT